MSILAEDVAGLDFSDVAGSRTRAGTTTEDASNRVTEIIAGEHIVTSETVILLGEPFRTSAAFWLNLQMMHDLEQMRRHMHRAA